MIPLVMPAIARAIDELYIALEELGNYVDAQEPSTINNLVGSVAESLNNQRALLRNTYYQLEQLLELQNNTK